jgi:hypothetical protein
MLKQGEGTDLQLYAVLDTSAESLETGRRACRQKTVLRFGYQRRSLETRWRA